MLEGVLDEGARDLRRDPFAEQHPPRNGGKKALYFAADAQEVWFCTATGKMTFYGDPKSAGEMASRICPKFPGQVEV